MRRQMTGLPAFTVLPVAWGAVGAGGWEVPFPLKRIPGTSPSRFRNGEIEGRLARWLSRLLNAPSGNFYQATPGAHRALMQLARQHPPAAILAQFGQTGLALLPVARKLGAPLAVHFHGADLASNLKNRWYRRSLLSSLARFDAMIVVGTRQRDWLLAQGAPADRVHLIPCGAPVAEFHRTAPWPEGPARFITVCRLVPQKGVDIVLEAYAKVIADMPAISLTVVGDGPERDALQARAAAPDLAGRVRFTGPLSPSGVQAELQQATTLVQHSRDLGGWYEAFGVSVSEAAAMELPVIASRCGGLVDQVVDGATGLIVEQRDIAGLAAAMQRLAEDRQMAMAMGRAGRQHIVENFDTAGQVAKLEQLLWSLLPGRDASGAVLAGGHP